MVFVRMVYWLEMTFCYWAECFSVESVFGYGRCRVVGIGGMTLFLSGFFFSGNGPGFRC